MKEFAIYALRALISGGVASLLTYVITQDHHLAAQSAIVVMSLVVWLHHD